MLALSALVSSETNGPPIISYFEKLSAATLTAVSIHKRSDIPISLPSDQTFYLLLMSCSLSSLSRICNVLVTYKTLLEARHQLFKQHDQSAGALNTFLMDTCNLLWRSRALISKDTNSSGCLCPPAVFSELQLYLPAMDRDYSLAGMFGLSLHPLLSGVSRATFVEIEDMAASMSGQLEERHSGPVSQRSLVLLANEGGVDVSWTDYRVHVLDWLEKRGLVGIKRLMYATMRDLIGKQ
jgi:centromere protein I